MRHQPAFRKPRKTKFASLIYSEKRERWELRLGSSKLEGHWQDIKWAIAWSRWYSLRKGVPVRMVVPLTASLAELLTPQDLPEELMQAGFGVSLHPGLGSGEATLQ